MSDLSIVPRKELIAHPERMHCQDKVGKCDDCASEIFVTTVSSYPVYKSNGAKEPSGFTPVDVVMTGVWMNQESEAPGLKCQPCITKQFEDNLRKRR